MNLLNLAAGEAMRLNHGWIGPQHALLGVLRGDSGDVARQALERAGVDAEVVETWLSRAGSMETPDQLSPNPRWYTVHGRAEGFAYASGAAEPDTVHFLLAVLWDRTRGLLPESSEGTRAVIITAMRDLGVELPRSPLPELEPSARMTTYVEFPRRATDDIIALLGVRHPPGSGSKWAFNYKNDDVAYVRAESGIDLQGIVDEALARDG
ncbi:ClpA/ClpB-like protein [Nocardia tenerifensis]|uniref:ClpA/ClpB-like protein n=1 Tax=Nocardia tenerifensis TaxID=228006 RepID=A0A318K818_9NOCA|nr:Clp protease N-terminal domain-containing protein [Nocardia tenerifensis]PXX66372.1 ClpA/ClpB-like protein [Nocardia tenerifensis]